MIREGVVKGKSNGMLQVCFERPEACEKCGACSGNSHVHLAEVSGEAQIGDRVAVEMPDAKVLKISLIVYAVPLCFLIAGIAAGTLLFKSDLGGAAIGLILMALSYVVLRKVDHRLGGKDEYAIRLIAVVANKQDPMETEVCKNGNEDHSSTV